LRGAQPLSLAAADLDEDGVPDLVSGFATGKGGTVAIHRGNVHALWPYGQYRNAPPPAFYPDARTFPVPEAPDFLVTGDFDADGHWDVMTAKRGGNALYFLRGDGKGGLLTPQRIPLAGTVTVMIAGEVNRADGLTDIVVAVNTAQGARVLVFESPMGAAKAQPEIFSIGQPVTALALGHFSGGAMNDLAIAAGNQIVLVQGRDRMLSLDSAHRATVSPARITAQSFPFAITALATGDFTGAGPSIAALGDDGRVHILEHSVTETTLVGRALTDPNFQPTIQLASTGKDGKPVIVGAPMSTSQAARLAAIRELADSASAEWTERSVIALPAGFSQAAPRLVGARITGSQQDDLVVPDAGNNQIHVLSTTSHAPAARNLKLTAGSINAAQTSMELLTSLNTESSPAAVLPMRLNKHGLHGLVTLQAGQTTPALAPQVVPPANIFTVTNTLDETTPGGIPPPGSLRAALDNVNNEWNINNQAGEYSIVFNIPTSDPGYNPANGAFVIKPISDGTKDYALDPNFATVTIDGYTQPGASPNTLTNGDNAIILIQIDGSSATVPGGIGIYAADYGSVYRGLDFTGWNNYELSGGVALGGEGFLAYGMGDFIEGNYVGTDPTGKVAEGNFFGILVTNGPIGPIGAGNVVGGTTPQARNVISANSSGVGFDDGYLGQLQGNFIGTDSTGGSLLPNQFNGADLNCPTVTIGGTLLGAGNVISGSENNVDINDITDGGIAFDSLVQGNLIGTDVTGTRGLGFANSKGVGITSNAYDMTIGGTTPAARNIISGNEYGVYIFDNSYLNIIQGNYIGTDITGSKPLGNGEQGYISGDKVTTIPAILNTIGGSVPGAGNLISNNGGDGIEISGTSQVPDAGPQFDGSVIQGNYIGTDVTGAVAMPNAGNGIYLNEGATNNTIGGIDPGSGNLIANNAVNGVLIDPATANPGQGIANNTVGNTILSNGGTGVRINSGSQNLISENSIFGNGALGINLGGLGTSINSNCQSTVTGPNNSQNAPVLTAGTGTAFISATATDPNSNTSEFSNAVPASTSGDILSLLGSFNSLPNTTYTLEFFSSTTADPSGYGQGQTYLGNTTVTTGANCNVAVNKPVNPNDADMSVTLTGTYENVLEVGPDLGGEYYTAAVTNNGPLTASNVVLTDPLPPQLVISSEYCDVGSCQSPVTTSLGSCTVSANTVTCNLGTMAVGVTASIAIPIQVVAAGSITNTVSVSATQPDPNLSNNTASVTENATSSGILFLGLNPAAALVNTPGGVLLNISGDYLFADTAVTFNGTTLPIQGVLDNQVCIDDTLCSDLEVQVPASLLTTAGMATVSVTNPGSGGNPGNTATAQFTIESACSFTVIDGFNPLSQVTADGTDDEPADVSVSSDIATCPWTATSSVPWATIVEYYPLQGPGYVGYFTGVDINVAPNTGAASRSGSVTVAGQVFPFTQPGGSTCDYALDPASVTISSAGATGTVAVTATSSSCAYDAAPDSPWITMPNGDYASPTGNAVLNYTVGPNTGAAQTGYILVGGEPFQINQQAPSCYFTLSANSANLEGSGGTGSFGVTPSSPSCTWTAASSNTSLVSVTSGASGTGNGTVSYSVPANTGGPQTPTITVANPSGGAAVFTVNQASAFACTFILSQTSYQPPSSTNPPSIEIPASGESGLFAVNPSFTGCKWVASSNDPDSVTLTASTSGTGHGPVNYTVAPNPGAPRTLTITAGCVPFTIYQDGTLTSNPVPAITTLSPTGATAGSGAFTLTVNGSGFINGSVVNFNGNARTTTYVSATQLTAAILATDVASVGTPPVTVTNSAPGGGTSNAVTFNVTSGAATTPTVTVTPSPASITTAQGTSVTVTVSGTPTPTGSVTLTSGTYSSGAITLSSGSATINIPAGSLAKGTDTLTASYTPDAASSATYSSATGSNTVTVTSAATAPTVTVTPSPASITTAQALSVTVTVGGTPTPTGSVTLTSGSYSSGAVTLSAGSATINIPAGSLAKGTDTLTASYTPDAASSATYSSATGSNTVTVTSAATAPTVTVTPSPASITTAQGTTVTVTVSGTPTPTGSVTLTSGTYSSGAVTLSSGSATINIPAGSLAKGTDTLTANYTPDAASSATYTSATGSNTVAVTSPALITPTVTVTPSPSSVTTAQALSVTVALSGGNGNPTPTGSVTLTSGTYSSGAVTLSGGSATINVPAGSLGVGADTLTATYTPDSSSSTTYNSATGSNTVTVTAATVQVTVGTNPAGLSFSVDGTSYSATQTLTWTVGASHTLATTTPQTLAGTQDSFSAWSDGGALSHSVTASSTTTTYTATFTATAYQLTTAASPSADGIVTPATGTFYAPGTVVNLTATANAGFSFTNWTGSVASANSASTTVTMNAPESVTAIFGAAANSTPVAGLSSVSPLTFTATVGTTSAAQSATLTNSGNATLNITGITITGTNPTDFAIATGESACGTTLAPGANCFIYVTFTPASATTFSATLSVADNAAGSPQTASLTGTGTPLPTFTLSSPTAPQTIQPGGTAQFTITATAQNGTFSNAVALMASGLPAGAIATFTPASVTPGSSSANSTLSIQTGAANTAAVTRHNSSHNSTWPFATSALALIGLCLVPGRRHRRWITMALLLIASLGAFTGLTACGGGFGLTAAPQSYTITVTGTSGTEVQTTTVQLTVE
jgi:titin